MAEGGFKVEDARVSARSAAGTATTTFWEDGRYELAPVSGDAVLRVEKDGYVAQERKLGVQRDETADFELPRNRGSAGIDSVYTLTFTAGSSCTLSPELSRRSYLARISEKTDGLLVELDGPGFPGGGYLYGFRARRDGSSVRFDIHGAPGDPVADDDYIFGETLDGSCSMLQPCGPERGLLAFIGTANGSIGDRSIPTVCSGTVLVYTGSATSARCTGDHRLEFAR